MLPVGVVASGASHSRGNYGAKGLLMSDVPVRVWRVGRHSDSQYLLVLRDEARHLLPMVIGPCEAMAIWSVLRSGGVRPRRPMSHDLLQHFIERLGGRLVKVVIDDLWNGVYYAKLHISVDGEVVTVDARPSDAVAVALRMEAPLFAAESVMTATDEPEPPAAPEEAGPDVGLDLDDL
jgi:bifunctional DNase/RNase